MENKKMSRAELEAATQELAARERLAASPLRLENRNRLLQELTEISLDLIAVDPEQKG